MYRSCNTKQLVCKAWMHAGHVRLHAKQKIPARQYFPTAQFREVFLTPDYLGIAMEYAAGGDMFQHVTNKRGLSENEARWFFQQLVLGLDYCHKMVRRRPIVSV